MQIFIWTTLQTQQRDGNDWTNVKRFNIIDDPYSVSFTGEFLPIFDLENMVSTYRKDFSWENGPKFGRHWIFFFKLPDLYDKFQVDSQNIEQFYFLLLSYLVYYQIWLNYFENDRHFGYITKSWKGPGFKPSGVQVKFLPALCYWTWGLHKQLVSRVYCCVPKKNYKLKKRKILKRNPASLLFRFPAWKFEQHMSEQAQKAP